MKNMPVQERTLVLIKPDGLQRQLTGEIIKRFERKGLKIVAAKTLVATKAQAEEHYHEHSGNPDWFHQITDALSAGPIMAMVLEGELAIKCARQIIGQSGGHAGPIGTIRGDLSIGPPHNLVHGADSYHSAIREITIWFDAETAGVKAKPQTAAELKWLQAQKVGAKKFKKPSPFASPFDQKFSDPEPDNYEIDFDEDPGEKLPNTEFPPPWLPVVSDTSLAPNTAYIVSNSVTNSHNHNIPGFYPPKMVKVEMDSDGNYQMIDETAMLAKV